MTTEIRIEMATLDSEHRIRAKTFLNAMAAARDLLHEIDKAVGEGKFEWYFTELGVGSGIAVFQGAWIDRTYEPPPAVEIQQVESRIAQTWFQGLSALDSAADWPVAFSFEALEASKRLVDAKRDEVISITTSVPQMGRAELTERVIANVNEIVQGRYTTLGSLRGVIETVSVARSQPYFRIREEVGNRSILCSFKETLLPAVRDAFGRRVLVRGALAYSRHGQLATVHRVDEILPLDAFELDSVDHLVGIAPDFTDYMPAELFLELLHDEP